MRSILSLAMVAVVASSVACSSTATGKDDRKITLVRPANQTLRRGEINKVAITVVRKNISTDVAVKFQHLPAGVKVIEEDRKMKPEEIIVSYTLHADNSADLVTNHNVEVTAEGPDGLAASEVFEVTVKE